MSDGDRSGDGHEEKKSSWLQSTANFFVIVEAVMRIVSHLAQMYYSYTDITKEANNEVGDDNVNIRYPEDIGENNNRSPSYPLNPPDDIETDVENDACKVCMTNKIRTINLSCGHLVFCFQCCRDFISTNYVHNCPICRERIKEIKMIYQ
jgi:hypothetical protein